MIELFFHYEKLLLGIVHVVMIVLLGYGILLQLESDRLEREIDRKYREMFGD